MACVKTHLWQHGCECRQGQRKTHGWGGGGGLPSHVLPHKEVAKQDKERLKMQRKTIQLMHNHYADASSVMISDASQDQIMMSLNVSSQWRGFGLIQ